MWNCNFKKATNRGSGTINTAPAGDEFQVSIDKTLCGYFNLTPERYMWNGTGLVEWPGWVEEEAARIAAKALAEGEAAIRRTGAEQLLALGNPYLKEERETWITQEAEARAWVKDNSAVCPMISAMATTRGIPLSLMVQKIIENADLFKGAAGQILGAQQKSLDELG